MAAMNTFVLGADRSVGFWLARLLSAENHLCRAQSLESWERVSLQGATMPFFVIVPSFRSEADLDNVSYWISLANEQDAPIIFLSSLAVFNYQSAYLFSELDTNFATDGLAIKLLAIEDTVRQSRRHIILRTGENISLREGDLAHQMLVKIRMERTLLEDDSRFFFPTPDDDVANVLNAILKQVNCSDDLWGTYHFCGTDQTTVYRFSEALLSEVGQYEDFSDVRLMLSDDISSQNWLVPGSDNTHLFHSFGIKPKPWRAGLARICRYYYSSKK